MRKRRALAIGVVAIAVMYSVWWWAMAGSFERDINAWIADETAKGAAITPATVSVGGYPTAFKIALDGISLSWPDGFGFFGKALRVVARPWSIRTIGVAATGGYTFTLPPGGDRPALSVAGQTLRGTLGFTGEPMPARFDVTGDGIGVARTEEIGKTDGTAREMFVATLELSGKRPDTPPKNDTESAFDVSLHMIDVSAASLENHPLGGTIGDIAVSMKLMGPLPAAIDEAALKAWRDAGGNIELPSAAMVWGPLTIAGDGTVAFDSAMQPEGAFTARITGYEKAIDALAAAKFLKPYVASISKVALNVASKPGADGQKTATVPLSIQNRQFFLGPAPVIEIPMLKLK